MNNDTKSQNDPNQETSYHDYDKHSARSLIIPEQSAITAVKKLKFGPCAESRIDSGDLLEELFKQANEIHDGDLSRIERFLFAQGIALDAMFDRMLAQVAGAELIDHVQLFGMLALKAQAQSRASFATLAQIKNPDQTTFIKHNIQQQNNAINQQVNNNQESANSNYLKESTNELISEVKHETLDTRGTIQSGAINSNSTTMEEINRPKVTSWETDRKNECS